MADIQLYEEITSYTLEDLSSQLKAVPAGEDANLYIASPGGDLLSAFAIIDLMQASGKKFIGTIVGFAASAAAIIALAFDTVRMSPLGLLMIHSAWCVDCEDSGVSDGIEQCNRVQLSIINKRNPALGKELFRQDNWYTAEEAKSLGLVDEIYNNGDVVSAACSVIAAKIADRTIRSISMKNVKAEIPVEEMVEQVVEEKIDDEKVEEKVEEQVEEPKADLMTVIEKLIERVNELEKRIEEMKQPKEEVIVEGACGEDDGDKRDQERIGAMLKSLVRPQACAPIGMKAEAEKKVVKIDAKKFRSFLND